MHYAIAKRAYDGHSATYITAIKRRGLSIDNKRIFDERLAAESWNVRKWATADKAAAALAVLADVGGYDDYIVVTLPGA